MADKRKRVNVGWEMKKDKKFVVPDGVIDPKKNARRRKKDKTDDEYATPSKKQGRRASVEKVIPSTPKKPGRPPNNRNIKSQNEECSEDEEEEEAASSSKSGARSRAAGGGGASRKNGKRIRTSSEESQGKERNKKTRRMSKNEKEERDKKDSKKRRNKIDTSDEEEEASLPDIRGDGENKKKKKHGYMEDLFGDDEEYEEEGNRGQGGSKGRRKKTNEESEESEYEAGDSNVEEELEMPKKSSHKKTTGRTTVSARELYEEKEKRKRQRQQKAQKKRKEEEARQKAEQKQAARLAHYNQLFKRDEGEEGNGDTQSFYFTSRHRSIQRTPEREIPHLGGSRSGSPVKPSGSPSREASPVRDPSGSTSASRAASPQKDQAEVARMEKEQRKAKLRQIRLDEDKEAEKKKILEERKEKEKEKGISPAQEAPEKPRMKAKTVPRLIRTTRDPGIVDDVPSSSKAIPRTKMNGGEKNKTVGVRPSNSSANPLDNILDEITRPLPSAPSYGKKTGGPFVNQPTKGRPTPSLHAGGYKMARRVDNRGASGIHAPPPRGDNNFDDEIIEVVGDPDDPIHVSPPPSLVIPMIPIGPGRGGMPSDSMPGTSRQANQSNWNEVGREMEDHYEFQPASPDESNAPASPAQTERAHEQMVLAGIEDELVELSFKLAKTEKGVPEEGVDSVEKNTRRANNILTDMCDYLVDGRVDQIIWALDWLFEAENQAYFDHPPNRKFIFDLIIQHPEPPPIMLSSLSLMVKWDENHLNRQRRVVQSEFVVEYLHSCASLSFAVIPFNENDKEGILTVRKTPLSDAVRRDNLAWSTFFIKMGAFVNEKVVYHALAFDDIIITLAVMRGKQASKDHFNIIRLLLSYGANREWARASLETMRNVSLRANPGLDRHNFNLRLPFYESLSNLLNKSCNGVANGITAALQEVPSLHPFKVEWVRETVSSTFYNKCLVVKFEEYYKRSMREISILKSEGKPCHTPVFAVVVSKSEESVLKRNEPVDRYRDVEPGPMNVEDNNFLVFPCVKKQSENHPLLAMNIIPLDSLEEDLSVFIVPPHFHEFLMALIIETPDKKDVPIQHIVYGGLVRLIMTKRVRGREEVESDDGVVLAAVEKMRGARGMQYAHILNQL